MTALHLMVMERTNSGDGENSGEGTVVRERTVGVRMAQKAMTMGAAIKAETMTGTMGMKNPNTVVWGQAALRPAKKRMPPPKNRHPRQRSHREGEPRRRGPHPPNHLPREQTREKGRRPAVSSRDSSRMELNIPVLV